MVGLPALGQQRMGAATWAMSGTEGLGSVSIFLSSPLPLMDLSPPFPQLPSPNTIFFPNTERSNDQREAGSKGKERERAERDGKVVPQGRKVRLT